MTLTKEEAKLALPIIKGALALLENKGWCQGASWVNDAFSKAKGYPSWKKGLSKDRFCAFGAVTEFGGKKNKRAVIAAVCALHDAVSSGNICIVNGSHAGACSCSCLVYVA